MLKDVPIAVRQILCSQNDGASAHIEEDAWQLSNVTSRRVERTLTADCIVFSVYVFMYFDMFYIHWHRLAKKGCME
jgi:hypothetical protein